MPTDVTLDQVITESGAGASIPRDDLGDIKTITKILLRFAEKYGCADKVEREYAFKIAVGVLGNWQWQLKRIREGKQDGTLKKKYSSGLWTPR